MKRKTGFGFSSLCFFEFSTCAVTPRQQQQQQQLQVQVQVQQQGLQGQVGQGQVMGRIAPESIGTGTGLLVKAANCAVVVIAYCPRRSIQTILTIVGLWNLATNCLLST